MPPLLSLRRELVNVRSADVRVTEAAERPRALVVGEDEDEVRARCGSAQGSDAQKREEKKKPGKATQMEGGTQMGSEKAHFHKRTIAPGGDHTTPPLAFSTRFSCSSDVNRRSQ